MVINKSFHKRITVSVLILLHMVAILLPVHVVSAADMEVVIPKEQVDAMVYQALWRDAYKDGGAVEAMIYDLFIVNASESGLDGDELATVIGEFQEKVEAEFALSASSASPRQQQEVFDDPVQSAERARQMLRIASGVKELQPVVRTVWQTVARTFGQSSGVDQASSVARASRNSTLQISMANLMQDAVANVINQSQTNIFIAKVCDQVHKKRTKVSVRKVESVKVVQENPNLGIPQEIIDNIKPNGTINITLNQLTDLSKKEFNKIDASITDMRQTLVEIDSQQKNLLDFMNNAEAKAKAQAIAEAKAAYYEETLKTFRATISIVSTLADIVHPGLGNQVSTILTSGLNIADSMKSWLDAVSGLNGLEKLTTMSTVIMTGNVLGAVMDVVSLFGDDKEAPEQMILEEIGKLREQVDQLRTEMHDRFDRVDEELNVIYTTMQDRFNQIDIELGKINGSIKEVQKSLQALDVKLNRIERNNFEFIDALGRRPLLEAVNGGLGYQERTGLPMPYQPEFLNYENLFQTWATIHAFDPLAAGPSQRDYSEEALFDELNAFPMDSNLNYLNGWLSVHGYPTISDKRLPSPRDWIFASRAYVQLGLEWPQHMKQINPNRTAQMAAVSNDVEKAMRSLSTLTTVTGTVGSGLLITGVITNYDEKVKKLESGIRDMEADHFLKIRNSLVHSQTFDFYGGIDQVLQYTPTTFITVSYDASELPVPTNVIDTVPNYNRYVLADAITKTLSVSLDAKLRNSRNVPGCKPVDACPQMGTLVFTVTVESGEVLLSQLYLNAGRTILELNSTGVESVSEHVIRNWPNLKSRFERNAVEVPLTTEQTAQRSEQFNLLSTELERQLTKYQQDLYKKVSNAMTETEGKLHKDTLKAAGAKALVDSMVTLGLPNALGNDDFLHSLLYGNQRIVDDSMILQTYALSATQPITGSALLVNPRLEMERTTEQRQAALSGQIDKYLDAITAHTHVESVDYIAEARKDLDLTMLIVHLADQPDPAPGGNRIYLPLINR